MQTFIEVSEKQLYWAPIPKTGLDNEIANASEWGLQMLKYGSGGGQAEKYQMRNMVSYRVVIYALVPPLRQVRGYCKFIFLRFAFCFRSGGAHGKRRN